MARPVKRIIIHLPGWYLRQKFKQELQTWILNFPVKQVCLKQPRTIFITSENLGQIDHS